MCDPVSAGLALAGAGTVFQTISGQQTAHAQKATIAQSGVDYNKYLDQSQANFEGNRTTQNATFDKNQGTVADTLANYSAPNQQAAIDAAGAKRETAYTNPLTSMSFAAPGAADAAPNSAVTGRNNATASTAQAKSMGEAVAKAKLDAYGDARIGTSEHAASNAADISIADQAASNAAKASGVQQNVYDTSNAGKQALVPLQMDVDKKAGATMGGIGDLFTAASQIAAMGGGGGFGGGGGMGMSKIGQMTGSNAAGYGGMFGMAPTTITGRPITPGNFGYDSPFGMS